MSNLESIYKQNTKALLENEISSLPKIAKKLSKVPPIVEFENNDYFIQEKYKELFKIAFIHLLRNSLDHSIELAQLRIKNGIPELELLP